MYELCIPIHKIGVIAGHAPMISMHHSRDVVTPVGYDTNWICKGITTELTWPEVSWNMEYTVFPFQGVSQNLKKGYSQCDQPLYKQPY